MPPEIKEISPNHWTPTREVPGGICTSQKHSLQALSGAVSGDREAAENSLPMNGMETDLRTEWRSI